MSQPVEYEYYGIERKGEWHQVIYKSSIKKGLSENSFSYPIAHYKSEEKAIKVVTYLNEQSEFKNL